MANNILADGVKYAPHIKAFNDLADDRFTNLDRVPLLVYMIDTVPPEILPYLAEQFGVVGIKGLKYADTDQKKRDLIKNAIKLYRYKGTPWAIKEALKSIGISDCTIIEGGILVLHDGTYAHDGSIMHQASGWAVFRVIVDFDMFFTTNFGTLDEARKLILEYKNARSHLIDLSLGVKDSDTVSVSENFVMRVI